MSLLDKASLVQIPSGYGEGKLYSAKPTPTFGNELAINGDFTTDSDWTKGGGWSIVNGEAVHTGSGDYIEQGSLVQGTKYRVVIVVTQASGSGFTQIYMGGLTTAMTSPNTYTFDITAQSGDKIKLRGLNDCKVDSISVKEILVEDGDFDFSRSSTGTRVNSDGYIEEVPWNLVTYSEDYSSGSWVKSNTTTIANDTISPRGTQDATKIYPNSSGNFRHIRNNSFSPSSGLYTFSIFAKAGELDHLVLIDYDGGGIGIDFDLTNGVATDNATSPFDNVDMIDYGDGWYRCVATATDMYFYWILSDNGGLSVTANGTDGLFIWGAMVNEGTSVKPYIKTTDRLDVPRLDYSDGASCASLLLEPQRTNKSNNSEDWTSYSKNNCTAIVNQAVSPNGATTADQLDFGSGSGYFAESATTITAASTYSVFVKYIDYQYIQIIGTGDSKHYANFDIQNGAIGNVGSRATASIEDYGNGWYRCIINYNSGTFAGGARVYKVASLTAGWASGGGVAGSFYFWGNQMEVGTFVTSYIPTSGSTVTRTADVCENAGTSATFNDSEGVLFAEIAALANGGSNRSISISNGTTSNQIVIRYTTTANQLSAYITNGGVITASMSYTLSDALSYNKIALKYKVNDVALWVNGSEVATDTNATMPSGFDELKFSRADGVNKFEGKCKQLIYFNEALTDTELTALTTI